MNEPVMQTADALDLSRDEARALARRVTARHLDGSDWLQWEDLPSLSELAFFRLQTEVDALAKGFLIAANDRDRTDGIDSADLLEQATNG